MTPHSNSAYFPFLLQLLIRSSGQDGSLTLPFTVPSVTSLTSLLRQGEGFLTNPHHVILALGALQSVPLDRSTPLAYQSAFLAVHEALFAIIQCHPQVWRGRWVNGGGRELGDDSVGLKMPLSPQERCSKHEGVTAHQSLKGGGGGSSPHTVLCLVSPLHQSVYNTAVLM